MANDSPAVIIYNSDGYEVTVKNATSIPTDTSAIIMAGSDGTNSRYLSVDASGRQLVVGAGTAGTPVGGVLTVQGISGGQVIPVSGTVTSNQGTANSLANAWSTKITDVTNGPVAVKPASTTAVAADPSLVVTISPNSASLSVITTPTNSNAQIAYGDVALASVTTAAVRRTTYTEQTTNFTGSVSSSNANDTSAGTGARQIKITYVDQTGATSSTETATLNGVTAVNLISSNKCFIEKIEVISVGSGGSNAGTISLFTGAGGTGTTVGTIAVGNNQTFWTHHYVITGKTFNLTGITAGSTSSTVGAGSSYAVRALSIGVANAVEKQISDTVSLFGQSSQVTRNYTTAIPAATGPARITAYVTTLSTTSNTYRASFDYYDQ